VEYRLNLESAHRKMRLKNEILPKLQEKFENSLLKGKVLTFAEIAQGAEEWIDSLVRELNA
jgi:hypothetical protein